VASLEKAIETGSSPAWIKPWRSQGAFRNAFSNRPYSGINTILLAFKPFTDPRYATFNQIRKEGGMVRKGEKGTQIVLWRFLKQVNKTTVEAEAREAAQNGTTMADACRYPFSSEAGVHFKAVYLLALPQDASQKHKRG
jgi:antirestriction protein ArdC